MELENGKVQAMGGKPSKNSLTRSQALRNGLIPE
jgi:hypothetical protein